MTTLLGKIRLLRTTAAAIADTVLEEGRLAYLTDENSLVSGDGSNVGADLPRIGGLVYDTDPTLGADLDLAGNDITTGEEDGIGIGNGATASGQSGIAIGRGVAASGQDSRCIGYASEASGDGATCIGYLAVASGDYSFSCGYSCVASGDYGIALGRNAEANRQGMLAFAHGSFGAFGAGKGQSVQFVVRRKTTDATPTTLTINGGSSPLLTITSGRALFGTAYIAGILSTGAKACFYIRKFAIKNVGGTTSLIGDVETIGTDIEDDGDYDVAVTADDANDALQINVTGKASETIRWCAHIEAVEIEYGT